MKLNYANIAGSSLKRTYISPDNLSKEVIIKYNSQKIRDDRFINRSRLSFTANLFLDPSIKNFEYSNIYRCDKRLNKPIHTLAEKIKEVFIKFLDEAVDLREIHLNGWYVKAKENKPTILIAHGNGANITHPVNQKIMETLTDRGYGVLMIDYRGYGKSTGKPCEEGLYRDFKEALNYLHQEENIPLENIILMGHSLGCGVATHIAKEHKVKGTILLSPYTNMKEVFVHLANLGYINMHGMTGFPLSFYLMFAPLTQKFALDEKIALVKDPLAIFYSRKDEILPEYMAHRLKDKNPEAKLFISKTGHHIDIDWAEEAICEFIEGIST